MPQQFWLAFAYYLDRICGHEVYVWVESDRCSGKVVREEIGNYVKETYCNGSNGTEVCVYTVKNGTHNWPGGRSTVLRNDPEMRKVDATDIICKFFLAHPKLHADPGGAK